MLGLNSGSRDCIFIIKSRTGDLVSKNFFQYDSQGDSDNIGTAMVTVCNVQTISFVERMVCRWGKIVGADPKPVFKL